jgi:hypothetical protein
MVWRQANINFPGFPASRRDGVSSHSVENIDQGIGRSLRYVNSSKLNAHNCDRIVSAICCTILYNYCW